MKRLPLGISDFKQLIEGDYYYLDKTLFIQELIQKGAHVTLIPRPRRFGKTLNLSMLRYFFESTDTDYTHLFKATAIAQEPEFNLAGMLPVIFLTFKDIKQISWQHCYRHIINCIADEFARHFEILKPHLSDYDLSKYEAILHKTAPEPDFGSSLKFLSELLKRQYQKEVLFLLDEYDTPIHAAYIHGYYDQLISFMRSLLTGILKDNPHLYKGVITGILRTAKEGIFSGLNNLDVASFLQPKYADKFGFTSQEVDTLLCDQNIEHTKESIKEWYNGYRSWNIQLYNPWSIINCAEQQGLLKIYWVNTSDNAVIKKIIAASDPEIKMKLEQLLMHETVNQAIDEGLVLPGIENNEKAVWSLLLFSGYLTFSSHEIKAGKDFCALTIPNNEIQILYHDLIQAIFEQTITVHKAKQLLHAIKTGDGDVFEELLQEFIINSMSVFDFSAAEPEKSYHLFVLGLLVMLADTYQLKSNRESGYGRYDIMLIPKNSTSPGIIIEFKKVSVLKRESLEGAAEKALEQIQQKKYSQELYERGITNVIFYGIAFQGKTVCIKGIINRDQFL